MIIYKFHSKILPLELCASFPLRIGLQSVFPSNTPDMATEKITLAHFDVNSTSVAMVLFVVQLCTSLGNVGGLYFMHSNIRYLFNGTWDWTKNSCSTGCEVSWKLLSLASAVCLHLLTRWRDIIWCPEVNGLNFLTPGRYCRMGRVAGRHLKKISCSPGLVQLWFAGLPLRSWWTIGAPSAQGAFPMSNFRFGLSGSSGIRTLVLVLTNTVLWYRVPNIACWLEEMIEFLYCFLKKLPCRFFKKMSCCLFISVTWLYVAYSCHL